MDRRSCVDRPARRPVAGMRGTFPRDWWTGGPPRAASTLSAIPARRHECGGLFAIRSDCLREGAQSYAGEGACGSDVPGRASRARFWVRLGRALPRPGGGDVAGRSRRSTATTPRGRPRAGPHRAGPARACLRVARRTVPRRTRHHGRIRAAVRPRQALAGADGASAPGALGRLWISTRNRQLRLSAGGSSDAPPVAAARSASCHWTPPFGGTAAVMTRAAISSS